MLLATEAITVRRSICPAMTISFPTLIRALERTVLLMNRRNYSAISVEKYDPWSDIPRNAGGPMVEYCGMLYLPQKIVRTMSFPTVYLRPTNNIPPTTYNNAKPLCRYTRTLYFSFQRPFSISLAGFQFLATTSTHPF